MADAEIARLSATTSASGCSYQRDEPAGGFLRDDVDLAVRHGFGRYEGLESIRFIDDSTLPVCSTQLFEKYGPLQVAGDLKCVPLLHDENRNEWRRWLETAGATEVDASGAPCSSTATARWTRPRPGMVLR